MVILDNEKISPPPPRIHKPSLTKQKERKKERAMIRYLEQERERKRVIDESDFWERKEDWEGKK